MPRVLLIDPDRDALVDLQEALGRAGFGNVVAVNSGSFALTMLERDRPDLIVSRARVPDIDGYELCAIVRNDPSMAGVLFLLLAGPDDGAPEDAGGEGPDRTLVGEFTIATIVSEVTGLLAGNAPAEVTAGEPASPAAPPEAGHSLRGSIGVMDLPDITQAIALGGKTGLLRLVLPAGAGVIVFDGGRVVHAEFFGLTGETAFAALLMSAHGEAQGHFMFTPLEAVALNAPRTIRRSLEQLLLGAATEIDEGRVDTTVAPVK